MKSIYEKIPILRRVVNVSEIVPAHKTTLLHHSNWFETLLNIPVDQSAVHSHGGLQCTLISKCAYLCLWSESYVSEHILPLWKAEMHQHQTEIMSECMRQEMPTQGTVEEPHFWNVCSCRT